MANAELAPYALYVGKSGSDAGAGSFHLLAYHCLDVAASGEALLSSRPRLRALLASALGIPERTFTRWAVFFLALHDLGKFSDGFQAMLRGRQALVPYERHDSLGLLLWRDRLATLFCAENLLSLDDAQSSPFLPWLQAVTGHHGQPPRTTGRESRTRKLRAEKFFLPENVAAAAAFCLDLSSLLPVPEPDPLPPDLHERLRRASWWLAGFTVLCDWIGSDQEKFPLREEPMSLTDYWHREARPRAGRAVVDAGLLVPQASDPLPFEKLFPHLVPTPLQSLCAELPLQPGPQLILLEDVTGSGKSEAAFTLAHRLVSAGSADGVYVALPTMATANAMYARVAAIYRAFFAKDAEPSLILAHGARKRMPLFKRSLSTAGDRSYSGEEESAGAFCRAWLADQSKKAMLADFGVGTLDQALLAVLCSRHQCLRLFGLARKVLLVDEVHACDAYMLVLLTRLIAAHSAAGGTTVLLSATLPLATRRTLADAFAEGTGLPATLHANAYPLLTHLSPAPPRELAVATRSEQARSVAVEFESDMLRVVDRLVAAAQSGSCVCWVRNSVMDAAEAWEALAARLSGGVSLFHARFALGDRLVCEAEVLCSFGPSSGPAQRRGRILVATQVVEQSLDLDFDLLASDLAPIDLLIQRAGRLQRHRRDASGNSAPYLAADGRDPPRMLLFSPPPVPEPASSWLTGLLPRTAVVYPDQGVLWATARILAECGAITMPEMARDLIESVYGETAPPIPEALMPSSNRAEGVDSSHRTLARQNAINLTAGYGELGVGSDWWDEVSTPTRLGEPSMRLRLARWDGQALRPWWTEETETLQEAWALSEVSLLRRYVARAPEPGDPALAGAMAHALATMADGGRWSLLVPLWQSDGEWVGEALDGRGKVVRLRYGAMGLLVG